MIRYLSVCSGIEAFSKAVDGLPYSAVGFSEIEPFPCAVLSARYPFVPNMGDMTKINGWALRGQVDLLVGGTPCQGFSHAGLRGGLRDPRSGLAVHFVRLAAELRVPWLLWENVPGALSTSGGGDYRAFVSALDELGYGLAWAVLDAQWFGVPQRRKRLFLVGRLGDWRGPCQVLFEPDRVCGNPPPRRSKRQGDAPRPEGGAGKGSQPFDVAGTIPCRGAGVDRPGTQSEFGLTVLGQPNEVSATLCASGAGTDRPSAQCSQEGFCVVSLKTDNTKANGFYVTDAPVSYTLDTLQPQAVFPLDMRNALRDPSREGRTGVGFGSDGDPANTLTSESVPAVAPINEQLAFNESSKCFFGGLGQPNDPMFTLDTKHVHSVAPLDLRHLLRDDGSFGGLGSPGEPVGSLTCGMTGGGNPPAMAPLSALCYPRRLTPKECERLMGFPDGWTNIMFQGKPARDSLRYRALGNSMAVPVMRWLAEGILKFF
jgi:DNA (cytosine-5)-methyltransferase 1